MEILKVKCGTKPADLFLPRKDGRMEVWLYQNIEEETDLDGNTNYTADAVNFYTSLTKEEIEARKDGYFVVDEEPTTDELAAMAYVNSELALALLEAEEA